MGLRAGLIVRDALADQLAGVLAQAGADIVMRSTSLDGGEELEKSLRQTRPELILLDVQPLRAVLDEAVRTLSKAPSKPVIVAVCASAETELMLGAFRAGIAELLVPPFTAEAFQQALERIERKRAAETPSVSGKAVAFLSATGGCGATALACHTAAEIARLSGSETALLDFDIAAGAVALWMKADNRYSVIDAANNLHRLDSHYWSALVNTVHGKVDVLAAPETPLMRESPPAEAFADVLAFARTRYPFIVADLGCGASLVAVESIKAADAAFFVTSLNISALYQARRTVRALLDYGVGKNQLKLICNRTSGNHELKPEDAAKLLNLTLDAIFPEEALNFEEALAAGGLLQGKSEYRQRTSQLASQISGARGAQRESRFAGIRNMFAVRAATL